MTRSPTPLAMPMIGRRTALAFGAAAAVSTLTGTAQAALPAGLEAAAKKDGKLNVIALPPDWANYGAIISTFEKMYGIKITSENPEGSSAQELQAIRSLKGQSRAPDVVDVGPAFAVAGAKEGLFTPYKVSTWNDIPAEMKDAGGLWWGDYFGVISLAANRSVVKTMPASWADLKKPAYKHMVSLNGDPMGAAAAFSAVFAASLANGGSFDDIAPGVHYFGELAKLGNFNPAPARKASLITGQTPITLDWDYLNLGYSAGAKGKATIDVVVPAGGAPFGGYYCQAISKTAPNLKAAQLWQEFLYSDQGQILFLQGFAHPARFDALVAAGKIPPALMKQLPAASSYKGVKFPSLAQQDKAKKVLSDLWPKVVKAG